MSACCNQNPMMEFVTYLTSFINCFSLVALLVMRGIALYKNADYQERRINHIKNKEPLDMINVEVSPLGPTPTPSPEFSNNILINRKSNIQSINRSRTSNNILINNGIKLSDDSSNSPNELNSSQPISSDLVGSSNNSNNTNPPNSSNNTNSPNCKSDTLTFISSVDSNKVFSDSNQINSTEHNKGFSEPNSLESTIIEFDKANTI